MTDEPNETCPPLLWEALQSATEAQLAGLMGMAVSSLYEWQQGLRPIPATKRKWLERWNRSHPDTRAALLYWSQERPRTLHRSIPR